MNFIRLLSAFLIIVCFGFNAAYSLDIDAPLGEILSPYDEGVGYYGPTVLASPFTSKKNSVSLNFNIASVSLKKMYLQKMKQYTAGISYGASDNIELSAAAGVSNARFDRSFTGISDIFLNAKYNPQHKSYNFAYILGVNIPAGDKDIYGDNNGVDITFDIPYQTELSFAVFNASAGFTFLDISKNSEFSYNSGLGLSKPLSDKISLSLETVYTIFQSNFDFSVYLGIKYKATDNFQFQAVCGKQIDENIIDSVIAAGFSINL